MIPPDVQTARSRAVALRAVLRDGYETACSKGFAPATWDALPSKIAFAFTELREAELAAHSDVPPREPWTREVIDYAVRVGGVLVGLYGDDWHVRPSHLPRRAVAHTPVEVVLWPLVAASSDAIQAWRAGEATGRANVLIHLERAIADACAIYEHASGLDAIVGLREVVDANKGRAVRHGHAERAG